MRQNDRTQIIQNNVQIYKMENMQNSTIYKIENSVCTGMFGVNLKCNNNDV